METIKILMADDHPVVRAGIRGMLETQPDFEVIAEAENGQEAVDQVAKLKPDVVLMDLRMPEMDGVAAIGKIKENHPEIHIMVLTTYDTDADIVRAVEAGATGYLLKRSRPNDILAAIRDVVQGGSPMSPQIARKVVQFFHKRQGTAGELEQLTKREAEILSQLAKGSLYKEIADEMKISLDTVRTHVQHIYGKLQVHSRTEAVVKYLELQGQGEDKPPSK